MVPVSSESHVVHNNATQAELTAMRQWGAERMSVTERSDRGAKKTKGPNHRLTDYSSFTKQDGRTPSKEAPRYSRKRTAYSLIFRCILRLKILTFESVGRSPRSTKLNESSLFRKLTTKDTKFHNVVQKLRSLDSG